MDQNVCKHWPMEATVVVEKDGKIVEEVVPNIVDGKFAIEQVYAFHMNVGDIESDESVTVHRCCIPVGTPVEEGYFAVRDFVKFLGYCPAVVCPALGFHEVVGLVSE